MLNELEVALELIEVAADPEIVPPTDDALDADPGAGILVLKAATLLIGCVPTPGVIVTGKAVMVVTYPPEILASGKYGVIVVVYCKAIVVVMKVVLVDVVE